MFIGVVKFCRPESTSNRSRGISTLSIAEIRFSIAGVTVLLMMMMSSIGLMMPSVWSWRGWPGWFHLYILKFPDNSLGEILSFLYLINIMLTDIGVDLDSFICVYCSHHIVGREKMK